MEAPSTMKCFDPILVFTSQTGKRIFRNFSMASTIIKQAHQQVFSCGKCLNCRKSKARELASRCLLQATLSDDNCFLTLTYDEKKKNYHNELEYRDIQLFKKKLRSQHWRHEKQRAKIFNVHEYGKNGKKHWHLICFNYEPKDKKIYTRKNDIPLYTSQTLEKLWGHGFVTIGDVSEASAMYTAQYMEKDIKNGHEKNEQKKSKSNHQGLGKEWFYKNYKQVLRLGFVPVGGKHLPLPRYFEKLAHKHFSYYYEKINFIDLSNRKAIHRPFTTEKPNKQIADLYIYYRKLKDEKIEELEKEWQEVMTDHLINQKQPDFIKSGENALYELNKNQKKEIF